MSEEETYELGRSLKKRSYEMAACGQVISVRKCSCCGELRPESGSFADVHRSCKARTCPYCSRTRGLKLANALEMAVEEIPVVKGYEWQFLTQTFRYDPDIDSDDMSWKGLRRRVLMAGKVTSTQWKKLLKSPGAAMHSTTEVSPRGMVHVHSVYYGPPVKKLEMEAVAASVNKHGGFVLQKTIEPGEIEDGNQEQLTALARNLRKTAIYSLKGHDNGTAHTPNTNEDWMEGAGRVSGDVIDPKLAARWEVATFNLKLSRTYGKLRGVAIPDEDDHEPEEPLDNAVACEECGTVGEWESVIVDKATWFQDCHFKKGKAALEGGHWIPPWFRKKKKRPSSSDCFVRPRWGKPLQPR